MNPKQALLDLQQLQQQYPAAFKRNILFYGFIQSKGMLDDWKEMIPWVLACLIFYSYFNQSGTRHSTPCTAVRRLSSQSIGDFSHHVRFYAASTLCVVSN